uniref:(northern house mosquito) hypothetical protein n=1 Tax=Culex pipiens TaxID=7175 RepID=A0A8D8JDB7_CULPI
MIQNRTLQSVQDMTNCPNLSRVCRELSSLRPVVLPVAVVAVQQSSKVQVLFRHIFGVFGLIHQSIVRVAAVATAAGVCSGACGFVKGRLATLFPLEPLETVSEGHHVVVWLRSTIFGVLGLGGVNIIFAGSQQV